MENPKWRYEDEENFSDVVERAKQVILSLEEREEEKILVVTHGHFLRHIASYLLMKKELTADVWLKTSHTLLTSNTGITVFKLENDLWQLITWNDYAHLAE